MVIINARLEVIGTNERQNRIYFQDIRLILNMNIHLVEFLDYTFDLNYK